MTNAELKKELSKYPDDAKVIMYDDIHEFLPNKIEALDMLGALDEIGLTPCHSDFWVKFHPAKLSKK